MLFIYSSSSAGISKRHKEFVPIYNSRPSITLSGVAGLGDAHRYGCNISIQNEVVTTGGVSFEISVAFQAASVIDRNTKIADLETLPSAYLLCSLLDKNAAIQLSLGAGAGLINSTASQNKICWGDCIQIGISVPPTGIVLLFEYKDFYGKMAAPKRQLGVGVQFDF